MNDIFLFTHKYFYAREITEYLGTSGYQVLSYWKEDEFLSVIENSIPWIVIVDYEIGKTDWNTFFERLKKAKAEKDFHLIALSPKKEVISENLFDTILYRPVLLKDLNKQINIISLKEEISEETLNMIKENKNFNKIQSHQNDRSLKKENNKGNDNYELKSLKAENLYLKAYIYYLKGNKKDAKRKCEECLKIDPEYKKALNLIKFVRG